MKFKRFVFVISLVILSIFSNICMSSALSVTEIPKVKIDEFPENLELCISQECSGHTYFMQADANENGDFVVLSHKEKYDKENNDVFSKKYIDVYNSEGDFCYEIIFTTERTPALRMDGNTVYLIFYNNLLTFDIETKDIKYYEISGDKLWEYTNSEIKQKEEFVVGGWNYECKRNIEIGFVKLIRSNDTQNDVLIEMAGPQIRDFYGLFYGVAAIFILIIIKIVKNKHTPPSKKKTGDDLQPAKKLD